jgi:hypothetical protein
VTFRRLGTELAAAAVVVVVVEEEEAAAAAVAAVAAAVLPTRSQRVAARVYGRPCLR